MSTSSSSTAARCSRTARSCRSARRSCRRPRSSANTDRSPGTPSAPATNTRRRLAACCRGRRSTATRATTCGWRRNGVLAFRARGYKSWGEFPGYLYFGGNSELRGYDYLEFLGNKAFFLNAELRFPLIEAALTPLGVIGGLRGVAFAGLGAAGYEGLPMQVYTTRSDHGHAAARVRAELHDPAPTTRFTGRRRRSTGSSWSTAGRPTASGSRRSRSASRSTSTGRGARCSTRTTRTTCSRIRASRRARPAASGSGSRVLGLDRLRLLNRLEGVGFSSPEHPEHRAPDCRVQASLHRHRGSPRRLRGAPSAAGRSRRSRTTPHRLPALHHAAEDLPVDRLAAALDSRGGPAAGAALHAQGLRRPQLRQLMTAKTPSESADRDGAGRPARTTPTRSDSSSAAR